MGVIVIHLHLFMYVCIYKAFASLEILAFGVVEYKYVSPMCSCCTIQLRTMSLYCTHGDAVVRSGRFFLLNKLLNKAITALHLYAPIVYQRKRMGGEIYVNTKQWGYPIKLFLLHKVVFHYPFASIHPNDANR